MKINYPDGRIFNSKPSQSPLSESSAKKKMIFGDRGMTLEEEINESNKYYRSHDIAVIYKKPTPIQIVKVDYPKRSKAVIREAYFRHASTTDYNGVYNGYYVDFEAKETKNKNIFPLKNFHQHQIDHLKMCQKQGGICFVIIKYVELKRYFVTPADEIFLHWDAQKNNGAKSIQLKDIVNSSIEVKSDYNPTLPYINAVQHLIESGKEKK